MQRNLPPSEARDIIRTVRTFHPSLVAIFYPFACPSHASQRLAHPLQTGAAGLCCLWSIQRQQPRDSATKMNVVMQQLAELVGKNLNQLAGLGGLTFSHYQNLVLPCITEQIVQCQDKLAQRFLMEVRLVPCATSVLDTGACTQP